LYYTGQSSLGNVKSTTMTDSTNVVRATQLAVSGLPAQDVVLTSAGVPSVGNMLVASSATTAQWTNNLVNGVSLGSPSTTTGNLVLYNAANANTITVSADTTSASYSLTLPPAVPINNNAPLISSTLGVLTFGQGYLSATGTLTRAQLLALNTTYLTMVPAPGVGKIVVVHNVLLHYIFGTRALTFNSGGLRLRYYDGTAVQPGFVIGGGDISTAFINGVTTDNNAQLSTYGGNTTFTRYMENARVELLALQPITDPGAPPVSTSSLKWTVFYSIMDAV
jgi:hypothetical protein